MLVEEFQQKALGFLPLNVSFITFYVYVPETDSPVCESL